MKRILVLLLCMMLLFSGCTKVDDSADTTLSTSESTIPAEINAAVIPQNRRDLSWQDDPWDDYQTVVEKTGTPQEAKTSLDIPVYYEEDLLYKSGMRFALNRDASFYYGLSSLPNGASAILAAYPTDALRVREDGISYAIYDTETGFRWYLFLTDTLRGPAVTIGFPIVIKNMLSYSDFESLKIGDSILAVEAIDDVATLHKRQIHDVWGTNPVGAANLAKMGHPLSSIHYLKDGILKIEYTMLEDQSLIVSNIIFHKDFCIQTADGNWVSHKIEDADLPAA